MPSLLTKKRRQTEEVYHFYSGGLSPASKPKTLYVTALGSTSLQCFVPNIGRAVIYNVQSCQAPQQSEEVDALRDLKRVWGGGVSRSATPQSPRRGHKRLQRHLVLYLETAIREAEEKGTIHDLADSVIRVLYASVESETIRPADHLLARACRLERRTNRRGPGHCLRSI